MNLLGIIILLLLALLIGIKIYNNVKKHTAAMNALVAKATYQRLSELSRKEIENKTIEISEKGWHFSKEAAGEALNRMSEGEKYGFYALAMLELDTNPISTRWR